MILGDLFLLAVLLIIVLLGISYLYYKIEYKKYKKRGWDPSRFTNYFDCVGEVFSYFMAFSFIVLLLYVIITNWNVPIL